MPRSRRKRAMRTEVEPLDAVTLAELKRALPAWLGAFLLHRIYPDDGTANARLLELLIADPVTAPHHGLLYRSPLREVWLAHRGELVERAGKDPHCQRRDGMPWAANMLDRDPFDPANDPRKRRFA